MYDQYGHWHDVYWYQDYGHHVGILFNIIILLIIIFGIVFLVQNYLKSPTAGPKNHDSPMDTLKKRYASGEINSEEFAQKKKDLET